MEKRPRKSVIAIVLVFILAVADGYDVTSDGVENSTRILLSSMVLESYLTNLKIDPNARRHALKQINQQFENIYNLEAADTTRTKGRDLFHDMDDAAYDHDEYEEPPQPGADRPRRKFLPKHRRIKAKKRLHCNECDSVF